MDQKPSQSTLSSIDIHDVKQIYSLLCAACLSAQLLQETIRDGKMKDHTRIVRQIMRMFGRYGLTGEHVFRYGFAGEHASIILLSILIPDYADALPEQIITPWKHTLTAHPDGTAINTWIGRFQTWFQNAPLDQVINLQAPGREEWERISFVSDTDASIIAPYVWLKERYLLPDKTETWHTTSLHCEYRYKTQEDCSNLPAAAIMPSTISMDGLCREIAKRAVGVQEDESARLYDGIYRHAITLLQNNACDHAAAVFRFYLSQHPGHPSARTALAFCLIPIEPEEAERRLTDMVNATAHPAPLVVYDLCSCLIFQGKTRQALSLARLYWSEQRTPDSPDRGPAHLWDVQNGDCVFIESDDVDRQLATLCNRIAEEAADKDVSAYWSANLEALQNDDGLS